MDGVLPPVLSLEHLITFVFLPTSEKQLPPECTVVLVAVASILSLLLCHPVVLFLQSFIRGEGLSLSTFMLRARLGLRKVTFAPPASWVKVNLILFSSWGANTFPIVWGFWGLASFCLMLYGIHCLDHAGCQGGCCDTNVTWDTSVPICYFEFLGN